MKERTLSSLIPGESIPEDQGEDTAEHLTDLKQLFLPKSFGCFLCFPLFFFLFLGGRDRLFSLSVQSMERASVGKQDTQSSVERSLVTIGKVSSLCQEEIRLLRCLFILKYVVAPFQSCICSLLHLSFGRMYTWLSHTLDVFLGMENKQHAEHVRFLREKRLVFTLSFSRSVRRS